MNNVRKMYHKGSVWSHHGRRRGVLGMAQQINRSGRWKRREYEMYPSVEALMKASRRGQ